MYAQSPSQSTYSCFLGDNTKNSLVKGAIAHHVFKGGFECTVRRFRLLSVACMFNHPHSSQTHGTWVNQPSFALGLKTVWKEEPLLIMFTKVTYSCFLGESTQLGNRTENSVVIGAIAHHVFKGRFDCVVMFSRPFSTAFMLNNHHCSNTHASWVNQPIYAITLTTVWYKEPLLILFSKVVLSALYVRSFRLFSIAFMCNHPRSSQTHGTWVNQPSYAITLKTVWKEEPLLLMISKVVVFVLVGDLRRFQHHICQITRTVHILIRPGSFNPATQ